MTITRFFERIRSEFNIAERKHPHFADGMICDDDKYWAEARSDGWRGFNDETIKHGRKVHAIDLLREEIWEALEAYAKGDLESCQMELAQCGAVILRMMDFVEKEKNKK